MQAFLIQPAGWKSFWLFVPVGLILVVVLRQALFSMPGSRPVWALIPIALVLSGAVGLVGLSIWGARASRFEVSPDGLRLVGDAYGRMIPAAAIRAVDARRVDLAVHAELRPGLKTMGSGFPGYRAGWFRLRNGEKALLYLTDTTKAVYIPTTEGYSVLVSPQDPEVFLSAVRSMSSAH